MVWTWSGLRIIKYAPLCPTLLSACNSTEVCAACVLSRVELFIYDLRPYDVRLWQAQGMCYEEIGRLVNFRWLFFCSEADHAGRSLREAVECYKRALIPADPHEITINLKLAKLHRSLEEHAEAVAYHRRVVEVCQADCEHPSLSWRSAKYIYYRLIVRPIQDYAKSSLEVAEYHMRTPDGDLILARDYLEQVAASNAEDVGRASELLKIVKTSIRDREQRPELANRPLTKEQEADMVIE